jgi:hypothetical protein
MITQDLFNFKCADALFKCQHELEKYLDEYPYGNENITAKLENLMQHMADVHRRLETPTE